MRPCKHRPPHPSCTVCRLTDEPTVRGAKYRRLYGEARPEDAALLAPARPPEPPGLLRKAANLVSAVAGHVAAGMPRATPAVHAARVAECRACDMNLRKADDPNPSCRLCGCNMTAKAWMAEKACPHPGGDRWAGLPRPAAPTARPAAASAASMVRRFDEHNLGAGLPGKRFNCSLLDDPGVPGGFLFCYRDGWAGSQIWLCRLAPDLAPLGRPWRLELHHPERASYGREDPRLFLHNGRVHLCYVGVVGPRATLHTNVLFARLTADCSAVEERWYAHHPARNAWEKNWQPFSHGGDLYAVYSASPHRVLRVGGESAELAYDTPALFHWRGGEVRGGAAPVRVGGEYWSFFHDRVVARGGLRVYRMGLYCFSAEPPFAVTRYRPTPILEADPRTKPADQYCAAVFPCGAVLRGGRWLISMGVHDRWSEIHAFDHTELESELVEVRPPWWWSYPADGDESAMIAAGNSPRAGRRKTAEDIYASVAIGNEYGLPERLAGLACLDVGAHVGSFARAAAARGAAAVHCYEPDAAHFAALEANAARMPGVEAFRAAVGSPVRAMHPGAEGVDDAQLVTLADAVRRLAAHGPAGRVDLLKIDAEGAEWAAFAEDGVPWHLVGAVVGEWHLFPGRGLSLDALFAPLRAAGFAVEHRPPASDDAFWGLFSARRP